MDLIRILILEDNITVLSSIIRAISKFEGDLDVFPDIKDIALTVFSESWQVEDYLNSSAREKFDIILIDRDCKANGSFHILDFGKFKSAEVIGISSIPEYNRELKKYGIKKVIDKDLSDLDSFIQKVSAEIESIFKSWYNRA